MEIQKVSKVSRLTVSRDEGGRFKGEIQLEGGGSEVDQALSMITIRIVFVDIFVWPAVFLYQSYFQVDRAFSMIREKVRVVGSWDCCNKTIGFKSCAEETNHDSLFRECFLDKSLVIRVQWDLGSPHYYHFWFFVKVARILTKGNKITGYHPI